MFKTFPKLRNQRKALERRQTGNVSSSIALRIRGGLRQGNEWRRALRGNPPNYNKMAKEGIPKAANLVLTCATCHLTVRDHTDNSPQGTETAF